MLPIGLMLIAGVLGALSNLCLKKSLDNEGSPRLFFIMQLFLTFLIATCLCPIRSGEFTWNTYTLVIAFLCGLFLGLMKLMISKALQEGSASLTFAAVNCASVMPALIITLVFGAVVQYQYTTMNLIGILLVFVGLIWATKGNLIWSLKRAWLLFAVGAFICHFLYLFLTQTHMLIVKHHYFSFGVHSEWFFPLVFVAAASVHFVGYFFYEKRIPRKRELLWGSLGGLLNGFCAFLFLKAAELSSGIENSLIFPLFSVTLIISCNLWGRFLYNERVNWAAHSLCVSGLVIGMA